MGVPGNADLLLLRSAAGAAATAGRSVRFNSADSAYLSRTPASAGNRSTYTLSLWCKRSALSASNFYNLFGASGDGYNSNWSTIAFGADCLRVEDYVSNASATFLESTAVFRDTSAWYHIVISVDTTQATTSNRYKLYVNGSQITTFNTANYPAQNTSLAVNNTVAHQIGGSGNSSPGFNGYLALVHFIDGQALTPSSFGETSATTGQWIAKTYGGTYGTNGFFLDFSDSSAATATTLGKDKAGSNNWTPNNLSVTAGSGNDSLRDHPTSAGTSTGAGGEVSGNYATLNPLIATSATLNNGNLDFTATGTYQAAYSSIGVSSGKWYFEGTCTLFATDALIGVGSAPFATNTYVGANATSWGYEAALGDVYNNSAGTSFGNTYTTNDVISVAFDADTGKLWFAKNGTWQASGNPAGGTNPAKTLTTGLTYLFGVSAGNTGRWSVNFGQRAFAYSAPSGFSPLVDTLLPTPTIAKPNTVMDVKLYTGNASTQTISGLAFSPDFVWTKSRANAYSHLLYDTVRGATKYLTSNNTDAEGTGATTLTAFNSDGFTLGSGENSNQFAGSVAWTWDAGANSSKTYTVTVVSGAFYIDGKQQPTLNLEEGSTYTFDLSAASNSGHPLRLSTTVDGPSQYTTGVTTSGTAGNAGATLTIAVASGAPTLYYFCTNHNGMGGQINTNTTAGASNFAGTITSTVRANISAGFSVVTYTGTGSAATVGHGLGAEPYFMIVKERTNSVQNWNVYHKSIGNTKAVYLNLTNASTTTSAWNDTTPSSTLFTLGAQDGSNGSGQNIVAYCWAPVTGLSSFGSYTGNGSSDGPFVYTGFRPRWVMIKTTNDAAESWRIWDSARSTYNAANSQLFPSNANAEITNAAYDCDFLSNGFKLRTSNTDFNGSADTVIYAAFAEAPFPYARAR